MCVWTRSGCVHPSYVAVRSNMSALSILTGASGLLFSLEILSCGCIIKDRNVDFWGGMLLTCWCVGIIYMGIISRYLWNPLTLNEYNQLMPLSPSDGTCVIFLRRKNPSGTFILHNNRSRCMMSAYLICSCFGLSFLPLLWFARHGKMILKYG